MKAIMIIMAVIVLISIYFLAQGLSMHSQVVVEEAEFHSLQEEYFSLAKSQRDAAPKNSELNAQLVEIKNMPSDLFRLKLVGVGKILTGIYALLLGILIALILMPGRMVKMMKK